MDFTLQNAIRMIDKIFENCIGFFKRFTSLLRDQNHVKCHTNQTDMFCF